jgi:phosphatidate cytidylyltransferase
VTWRSACGIAGLALYAVAVYAGHAYCAILVAIALTLDFNKLINMAINPKKESHLPTFIPLRWFAFCFTFALTCWYIFPEHANSLALRSEVFREIHKQRLLWMYGGVAIGLTGFVVSLDMAVLRYQFHQLGWLICALIVVVAQGLSVVSNTYTGLIWFVLPVNVVVVNDTIAFYMLTVFGKARRRESIQSDDASPMATISDGYDQLRRARRAYVPGLVPAVFSILTGQYVAEMLNDSEYFTCPQPEFHFRKTGLSCEPGHTFARVEFALPTGYEIFGRRSVLLSPLHGHALVISIVSSVITHFGLALYKSFRKAMVFLRSEEEEFISVWDRVHSHIMMGMFTFVWLHTFVNPSSNADRFITNLQYLGDNDQLVVFEALRSSLEKQGLLPN